MKMKWSEVQENSEQRLKELVKRREEGLVKDLKNWDSLVQSNEEIRKLAISSQGVKYEGRYIKIENGGYGVTSYSIVG
jgi:hypothetical protein